MITIPGSTIQIPGHARGTRSTRSPTAWKGMYLTLELYRPIEAMRVSSTQLGLMGDWFALGDWIQTRTRYRQLHALPGDNKKPERARGFRFQAIAVLEAGTIANVGTCGPLFGQSGGGLQAEFLEGPPPTLRPISATWVDYAGHA